MHNQSYSLIDPLEVFAAKSLSLAKTDDKGLGQRPVGKVHIFTSLHSTHGETSVYDTALQGTEICSAQRETSPHLTKKKKKERERDPGLHCAGGGETNLHSAFERRQVCLGGDWDDTAVK